MDQLKTRYIFSRETRAVFTTVARNVSSLIKNETSVTCFTDETCFYLGVHNALRETMIMRWFKCAQNKQIKDSD